MNKEEILNKLKNIIYPNFKRDIVDFGFVKDITINGKEIGIFLEIPSNNSEVKEKLQNEITKLFENVNVEIKTPQIAQEAPKKKNIAPNIKHFVMVSSGKGGVGKSTTSVNLSIALAQAGKSVGLLDADIYGPNIPRMLNLTNQKPLVDESIKKLIPLKTYGIKVMSMGMMYEEGQSLIWRGPMIMRAIEQMLSDVLWGELDILVIDMPPGTGDAQLTLAQSVPVSAGISVTTPQVVALDDSARSMDMFNKLKIPIAGIVENMSGFVCPKCNEVYDIFGKGGGVELAKKNECELLAQVPIEPMIRESGDEGKPITFFKPDSISAKEYLQAAHKIIAFLDKVGDSVDNSQIQPVRH
ncbi:Mrp/NBP35 family ATP-binding protein [Helicobacter sp. MIT 14-3879]|uniref:Mrp/NBP35 family ATP-binding protein n=1 Tax=Helicobacter sp. MIT 14-3879 TaxID=2040649 RepID=UPI000E1F8A7A|nr:Mrp/NBP35 family ATP-binding protein [Helicobacter sp. MIT 14-3879]RDU65523.1 sodium:proton antiporter [Helicobacter sp. MIT 14-3879]